MDKVAGSAEAVTASIGIGIFALLGILLLASLVTVEVPRGFVGFYVKKGVKPDANTPLLTADDTRWRRPFYRLYTYHIATVPDGCAALVYAHIGRERLAGYPANYDARMGDFTNPQQFTENGGQKGFQQVVLPAGTYAINPYAFTVIVLSSGDPELYGSKDALLEEYGVISTIRPEIQTDSNGDLTINVYPADVDDQLERDIDQEWAAGLNGQLADSRDFGFATEDGRASVTLNIMFPEGTAGNTQTYVDTVLRDKFNTTPHLEDPTSFVKAMSDLHEQLGDTDSSPYRITVSRARCELTVATGATNIES